MGRPPKPTEQKRLEGNPGHHPKRTPVIIGGRITPDELASVRRPAHLSPLEVRAWRDLIGPLVAGGVLDRVDLAILEMAAQALARARQARAVMQAEHVAMITCRAARRADPTLRITAAHPERCAWCETNDGELALILSGAGMLATNSQGRVAHPAIGIEKGAMTEFRLLAVQLGIGPGARVRLGGEPGSGSLRTAYDGGMAGELDRQLPRAARLRVVGDDAGPD